MDLYFDARMHDHPGIGRYIRQLIAHFPNSCAPDKYLLNKTKEPISHINPLKAIYTQARPMSLSEHWQFPKLESRQVTHIPNFHVPLNLSCKLITTIHDLSYIHEKSLGLSPLKRAYARAVFSLALRKSKAVIAVSEYTKIDIIKTFGKSLSDKIHVIPEASDDYFHQPILANEAALFQKSYSSDKPFILSVGTMKPHKNLLRLCEAWSESSYLKKNFNLVVIGRVDAKYPEIFETLKRSGAVCLGEASDAVLRTAYHKCSLFVLPSLREGFGLPILEAMACGAPVACSNASSLPEVGGKAAVYFDPMRSDLMAGVMEDILKNPSKIAHMKASSLSRAKDFTWLETASRTAQVYKQVMSL